MEPQLQPAAASVERSSFHGPRTLWEHIAQTGWGSYLTTAERSALHHALDIAGAPATALEVGAEGGRWSTLLAAQGWELICTETDPATLAICQARLPASSCIVVDPSDTSFPCDDGTIRLLVAIEVPPVSEADWFPEAAARALEPGGVLICTTFNPVSARGAFYRLIRRLGLRQHDAYRGPSYLRLRRQLRRAGLELVRERGYGWMPFTRESNSPLLPPAISLERALGLQRLPALSSFGIIVARKSG